MKTQLSNIRMIIREELERAAVDKSAVLYCDMDGVLVDFVSGAVALASKILAGESGEEWLRQSKSMRTAVKKIQDERGPEWRPSGPGDLDLPHVRQLMFAAISFSPGQFFSELKPIPDGISTLWPFLTSSHHNVILLTAPVGSRKAGGYIAGMSAGDGKKAWADNWLRPSPSSVIISPAKSKPSNAVSGGIANILIDDKASTIAAWNEATKAAGLGNGFGILHTPGNSAQTIRQLQALGIGV